MTGATAYELAACHTWQKSTALGDVRVGIIPAWNAVALLNPAAALIWDLLIDTGDRDATVARYARALPERAASAATDVAACLEAWDRQGLFRAPDPSPEQHMLSALEGRRMRDVGSPGYCRTLRVADVPVTLEIEDPTLAGIVAGLLADFPGADRDCAPREDTVAAQRLTATGPQGGWVLSLDGAPRRVAENLVAARGQIVAELVRLAAGPGGWLATIHGAALTGPSGPVFLAGSSGAGKSTLAAGLVALGWQILAEDVAGFDAAMAVHPLPFALSIKEGSVATLAADFPTLASAPVHALGPRRVRYQSLPAESRATRAERPRLILEVAYTADLGAGAVDLVRLSPVETLALFMNEESFVDFERDDATAFFDFVEHTPAYRIRYGSIAAAERAIRDRLDALRRDAGARPPAPRTPEQGT